MTLAELLRERLRAGFVACGVEGEAESKVEGEVETADAVEEEDYQCFLGK